jgi:peroxiredoxin
VPYREAITAVRKRAISASKGNLPPVQVSFDERGAPATGEANALLTIGKPVPDISAEMLTADATTKLSKLKGRPVLLAYLQPTSAAASPALKLAQGLHARYRGRGAIMPLLVGDTAGWKTLYADEGLTVPLYDGNPVYKTHGLDSTPVFVVVDADGIVRHVTKGWGTETAEQVTREFERWAK